MKIVTLIIVGFLHLSLFAQSQFFLKFKNNSPQKNTASAIYPKEIFKTNARTALLENIRVTRPFAASQFSDLTDLQNIVKVQLQEQISLEEFKSLIADTSQFAYIETGHLYRIDAAVNDSLYATQWALQKIHAEAAWNVTKGSDTVLIAVIDTGIDFLHPDIKNKVFINKGETGVDNTGNDKRFNGIDDDGNGFIDDYQGWDFTDRSGFPFDSTGGDYLGWDNYPLDENVFSHGTAVAGIIAAETNNIYGIAGVAPNLKVLNLRAFDPDGNGEEDDVAAAILYAVKMGAKVINMSFGDDSFSFVLRDVIKYAYSQNVVLIGSSGNSSSKAPHYPSGYSEVISVGNSTPEDYVASSSNYGSTLDLVAPGTGITTLTKGYNYQDFNGTSAAAPFVSAAAGLLLSKQAFSNEEVKQILKTTSDDIADAGWDERSGAGRLNLERALRVLAPSVIKFNYPLQDFCTASDSILPTITVLSPYFSHCNVYWGVGFNPISWNSVELNRVNQGADIKLPRISLLNAKDTSFTLRLEVVLIDGRTVEERVNFHKITRPPTVTIGSILPAYYGDAVSISAALYSDQSSTAMIVYKQVGASTYNYNSLDGFTVNNLFVKQLHYGFIPKGLLAPDTDYEVYFVVENLLGMKTTVKDKQGNPFIVRTNKAISNAPVSELPYSLKPGILYKDPVSIAGSNNKELLYSPLTDASKTYVYSYSNNQFTLKDSVLQRIPKDVGDFNKDGKVDILANWGRNGYILSQNSTGSTSFTDRYKNESGNFWPITVQDIDSDGINELLAVLNDATIGIYKVNSDYSLTQTTTIKNFSTAVFGANVFDYPSVVIADLDNNGKKEIWAADREGDVLCFNVNNSSSIVPDTIRSFRTSFLTSSSYLTTGDFNGDGKQDLAIILHSIEELDIASFYMVQVYTFENNQPKILFNCNFIDPSSEFNAFTRKTYNAIKLDKFLSNNKDDIILGLFPYAYGFSSNQSQVNPVFFRENVNANTILAGDFNDNGKKEFSLGMNDKLRFFEFQSGPIPNTPTMLKCFSINGRTVQLSWLKESSKYYIFRGENATNLVIIDSCFSGSYLDTTVTIGKKYFYGVKAVGLNYAVSSISEIKDAYHHLPAKLTKVEVNSSNAVLLSFSEQIKTTATELSCFNLINSSNVIIAAETSVPSGQNTMLLSFPPSLTAGTYQLKMQGFTDFFGSPVTDTMATVVFTSVKTDTLFYVQSFNLNDPHTITIDFNLPCDSISALQTGNYEFSPVNYIDRIAFGQGNRQITIRLKPGRPLGATGIETTLRLKNLHSDLASGAVKIKPNSAGSVLVFTKNAQDIENVYTYPNPVRISAHKTVMFANLPKYAEIHIFDVNGRKITTLHESDGNGGITWDLRDDSGQLLSSGIYYYRVRQLDDNNDEKNTKLFKFAVVR